MQFHASKIVSALILLNTTICLAMPKSSADDPYKIGIESATCDKRVYNKLQISMTIKGGLRTIERMKDLEINLDKIKYIPKPTEVMPSTDDFYFTKIKRLGRNVHSDLVIFSRTGLFAKVVIRIWDNQGYKYIDCVPSQTTPSLQELEPIWGYPEQNTRQKSGENDRFEIGITSVSCEGRVYNKLQISIAIMEGLRRIDQLNQLKLSRYIMHYRPMPTEVMPSNDKFYFSKMKWAKPNEPVDLVIFSPSGKFVKVVTLKEDNSVPLHIDCVSLSNGQSPERSPSTMGSSKRRRLRMKSPEREFFE